MRPVVTETYNASCLINFSHCGLLCDVVLVPAWRYPVEQKETVQAFCTFQPGTIFFLSVLKTFRLSCFSLIISTTLTARHHVLGPSLAEARRGRFSPAGAEPVAGFWQICCIGFSSVTFHHFLHGRSVSQRPLCVSGVRWMFFPPVAMRMVGLPLPPCGGPFVTFTTSHCHF